MSGQLNFITENQKFFIFDNSNSKLADPANLAAGTTYSVIVGVEYPTADPTAQAIAGTFKLSGGVSVIGNVQGTNTTITLPIPPASPTSPVTWVTFKNYTPTATGHGCIFVQIVAENGQALDQQTIQQDTIQQNTNTVGVTIGQPLASPYWFEVYVPAGKVVYLKLEQESGPTSWQYNLVIPPGAGEVDTSGKYAYLVGSGNTGISFDVQLQVKPDSTDTCIYKITGAFSDSVTATFSENFPPDANDFAGVVELTVIGYASDDPDAPAQSKLWMDGDGTPGRPNNYTSRDILLSYLDTTQVPPALKQVSNYDTLQPGTTYKLQAQIHNDGAMAAGAIVKFLRTPDGGLWNDADTFYAMNYDIPTGVTPLPPTPIDFVAPTSSENWHACAWVKVLANNDENQSGEVKAYRNTHSVPWVIHQPIHIPLEMGVPHWKRPNGDPVDLMVAVQALVLPVGWEKDPTIRADVKAAKAGGNPNVIVLDTPAFRAIMQKVDLPVELKVRAIRGVKAGAIAFKAGEKKGTWKVQLPPKVEGIPFSVTCAMPKDAQVGQAYMFVFSAKYPKIGKFPAQTVQCRALCRVVEKA